MKAGSDTRLALSAHDAAQALGISDKTLWALTKASEVPCLRIGRRVLYRVEALQGFLKRREGLGASAAPEPEKGSGEH